MSNEPWERRVEIGDCVLYQGDCREIIPHLDEIGMIVADPPYGVAYSTGRRTNAIRSSTQLHNDKMVSPLLNDTLDLVSPLLNDSSVIYMFGAPERLDITLPIVRKHFDVPNIICWDKGNCTAGDLETTYGQQWEACIYGRKSRVALLGARDRDVMRISRGNTLKYEHPTQKPVDLLGKLIVKHSRRLVLDPFMGSGTTGVACLKHGRPFVGIEIDAAHFETATRRLMLEFQQPDMLVATEPEQPVNGDMFADIK